MEQQSPIPLSESLGVKVWVYKGEVLPEKKLKKPEGFESKPAAEAAKK